jgi:hypothetical protein
MARVIRASLPPVSASAPEAVAAGARACVAGPGHALAARAESFNPEGVPPGPCRPRPGPPWPSDRRRGSDRLAALAGGGAHRQLASPSQAQARRRARAARARS